VFFFEGEQEFNEYKTQTRVTPTDFAWQNLFPPFWL